MPAETKSNAIFLNSRRNNKRQNKPVRRVGGGARMRFMEHIFLVGNGAFVEMSTY